MNPMRGRHPTRGSHAGSLSDTGRPRRSGGGVMTASQLAAKALAQLSDAEWTLELGQATEDGEQERQTVEVGDDQNVAGQEKPATRAISDSPAVRSAYKERETLPVAGRCRLHGGARGSGAPAGERNGQYRHGERTKGAI